MYPIIGNFFGFDLRSYIFFNALGVFAGMLTLFFTTSRLSAENRKKTFLMAFLIFLPFFLGGYFGGLFSSLIDRIPSCTAGGFYAVFSLWWGLITATLSSFIIGKIINADPWEISDYFSVSIAIGGFFARLACLFNGCCIGVPAGTDNWMGIYYPYGSFGYEKYEGVALHPVQFYEAFVWLLLFFILLFRLKKPLFKGELITVLGFIYGTARFFIEFYRHHESQGALSGAQYISIFIVITSLIIWLLKIKSGK